MNKKKVFVKKYCAEEFCDISRDVDEALDSAYNDVLDSIPKEDDFYTGTFEISITWIPGE